MADAHLARVRTGAWREAARYLAGLAVGVLVAFLLFHRRGELHGAVSQLGHLDAFWGAMALAAEAGSMVLFALLQRSVLGLAGADVRLGPLVALSLANDAIANTVPGEPAVSSAYRYRHYKRYGASGASAGWSIFTILVAQAIGMSLLLLAGVAVALATATSAASYAAAAVGVVIILAAGAVLVRRDLVLRLGGSVARLARRLTGHPSLEAVERVEGAVERMRAIPLSVRSGSFVVALATAVWGLDFCCLVFSFAAVRAPIPWKGVILAYGVAQIVATLPIVPGGLGLVEGSLAVILAAYGTSKVHALSVTLFFRIIAFWLAVVVGWAAVGLIALRVRSGRRRNSDANVKVRSQ